MFIAQSARRLRFARVVFLVVGVLPCAALAAWAVHLRSVAHRESLRARWQQAVGLPLRIGAVEHLRPGVVRGYGFGLTAEDGGSPLALSVVEIEETPRELRLRVERLDLDADAIGLLAGLAGEWLGREARFPRDCVIEVGDLRWCIAGWPVLERETAAGRLRIECVARDGTRAIRCLLADAGGGPAEIRIVRTAGGPDRRGAVRHDVTAACAAPLPLAIVGRLLEGASLPTLAPGSGAAISGTLAVRGAGDRWAGQLKARLERIDLAACAAPFGWRAAGLADVDVRRLDWEDGRLSSAEMEVLVGPGACGRGPLDSLVRGLGFRPREGLFNAPVAADTRFDAAGMLLRIDGQGAEILSPARLNGAVAVLDGRPLLDPPATIVPLARFADWLTGPAAVAGGGAGRLRAALPRDSQAFQPAGRPGF